jgi:hypothetical protein
MAAVTTTPSGTNRRPPIATVREWIIALGVLTAGNMTRAEAEMKLRAYVPLLQDNFPAGAFTQDSLHHVASKCKWFPTYAEVVEHLGEWWRPRRPPLVAIQPPDIPPRRPDATDQERAYVTARMAEITDILSASRTATARGFQPQTALPLSPGVLDALNPLPNGRKRVMAT